MWQALYDTLKDQNFMVVTVAMDSRPDAARPFIEAANPAYVSLIDRSHHVATLYNMANVPQAVWIDEAGRIVRPPEPAGAFEAFRARDSATGQIPPDILEAKSEARLIYDEAIRDWVRNGAASRHVYAAAEVKARLALPDVDIATAHANFRLGQFLIRQGHAEAAKPLFEEARRLQPKSWNIWRQTDEIGANGLAAGPAFRAATSATA